MLVDQFNRKIDYLRISVTDRCNLRCIYCMPKQGIVNKLPQELLTFEEIARIVKIAISLGIDKIRLTGGEPLVRKDIVKLVRILSGLQGIKDISLTTNAISLKDFALQLKDAGLQRLNISLDTLCPDKYKNITRTGNLEDVLDGIDSALKAGFNPLKINVLLLSGINLDEIKEFLRLTLENPLHVRFLEFMPLKNNQFLFERNFVSCKEVIDASLCFGEIESVNLYGNGPAKYFRIKNALGTFGIIAPLSQKFCFNCNRLRLTSDGFLKGCLHSDSRVNLKEYLRQNQDDKGLVELIKLAVFSKPKEHLLDENPVGTSDFLMCQIGG